MQKSVYPKGTILLLEEGEYSDFGYVAHLVTLQDLDVREAIDRFKEQYEAEDSWDTPRPSSFVAWLIATQQCAPLVCQTLHIGSYGALEL